MVNILLEGYDIDAPWLHEELKNYIQSDHKVAVVALAFRDSKVSNLAQWEALYGKKQGKYYDIMVNTFSAYGIPEKNITFINYFFDTKESAKQKIVQADIVYFLGGLPDKMVERIQELDLWDALQAHDGVVMGYSAGALVQLADYHLSPDEDYPAFGYYKGMPYLKDFYLEVHYENSEIQNQSIRRVLQERNQTVYATVCGKGAIIVGDGAVRLLGDVKVFER